MKNVVRAENCTLYDAGGNRYVDLESGVWFTSIGHSHPELLRVMNDQARRIAHTGFSFSKDITNFLAVFEKVLVEQAVHSNRGARERKAPRGGCRMPYNAQIEERIQTVITGWKHTAQKNMFGGICHLLKGNMFCGVYKEFLILRLGEVQAGAALEMPHVRPFDITGRPMKGWVMVAADGFKTDAELADWLGQAREFAGSLPPK